MRLQRIRTIGSLCVSQKRSTSSRRRSHAQAGGSLQTMLSRRAPSSTEPSVAPEYRLAFVNKGLHSFAVISRCRQADQPLGLMVARLGEIEPQCFIEVIFHAA